MSHDISQAEEMLFQYIKQLIDTAKQEAATAVNKELAVLHPNRQTPPKVLFKDCHLLKFLGLFDTHSARNYKAAILRDIENYLLQAGTSFASMGINKWLESDGQHCEVDLLLFNRRLKRLVAINLRFSNFRPAYKEEMALNLRWLAKHDKENDERPPIGIILCAGKKQEQIELLELDESSIHVAEYLTVLPPKELLQAKLHEAIISARRRLSASEEKQPEKARSPGLTSGSVDDAFFEPMSEQELQQWESNPIFPPE